MAAKHAPEAGRSRDALLRAVAMDIRVHTGFVNLGLLRQDTGRNAPYLAAGTLGTRRDPPGVAARGLQSGLHTIDARHLRRTTPEDYGLRRTWRDMDTRTAFSLPNGRSHRSR